MKLGTLIIIGAAALIIYQASKQTGILPGDNGGGGEPSPDPEPITDGQTMQVGVPIDIYDDAGSYHHTEILNADGTVGLYRKDKSGVLVLVKTVAKTPTSESYATSVSGIYGIGRNKNYARRRAAQPSLLV